MPGSSRNGSRPVELRLGRGDGAQAAGTPAELGPGRCGGTRARVVDLGPGRRWSLGRGVGGARGRGSVDECGVGAVELGGARRWSSGAAAGGGTRGRTRGCGGSSVGQGGVRWRRWSSESHGSDFAKWVCGQWLLGRARGPKFC